MVGQGNEGTFGKVKPAPMELERALERVVGRLPSPRIGSVPLAEAAGSVLAEEVRSDVAMPPFHRSAMDGYALRACDTRGAPQVLDVVGSVAAGAVPSVAVALGQAVKVMTGAPVPDGADAVVMVERTRAAGDARVEVLEEVRSGQHVARRGVELEEGGRALSMGAYLGAGEIGMLAAVGRASVTVYLPPRVAVLATGDELVPAAALPGPGQIRNGNGPSLAAAVRAAGCPVEDLGIARDDPAVLAERIAEGLGYDVLLISGGVSMGEHDHVDAVLRGAGVDLSVESVAIKPGKPLVFGVHPARRTVVFGLPGNPLSCLVGFTLLVAPALRTLRRVPQVHAPRVRATIFGVAHGDRRRRAYVRGVLRLSQGRFVCEPVASHGSADLPAWTRGNALIEIAEGRTRIESGESAWVLLDEATLLR